MVPTQQYIVRFLCSRQAPLTPGGRRVSDCGASGKRKPCGSCGKGGNPRSRSCASDRGPRDPAGGPGCPHRSPLPSLSLLSLPARPSGPRRMESAEAAACGGLVEGLAAADDDAGACDGSRRSVGPGSHPVTHVSYGPHPWGRVSHDVSLQLWRCLQVCFASSLEKTSVPSSLLLSAERPDLIWRSLTAAVHYCLCHLQRHCRRGAGRSALRRHPPACLHDRRRLRACRLPVLRRRCVPARPSKITRGGGGVSLT